MTRHPHSWIRMAIAAAAVLAATAGAAAAEDRALIVGVGRYRMPGANLPGIDKDVEMMREVARLLGFKDAQIKIVMDEEATLAGIQRAFDSWLVQGVGAGDRALFYFSGHGSRMADHDGDEPDRLDEIMIPHDFEPTSGDPRNALVDDMFGQWLTRIRSRRVYAFIDACHSGTVTRGFSDKFLAYPGMPDIPEAKSMLRKDLDIGDKDPSASANFLAVAAADDTEVAQASRAGSFFTQGLLKAVRDAVNSRAPLSILDIKNVSTRVVAELAGPSGKPHRPQISGDLSRAGENMLASGAPPPPAPPAPLPPPPPGTNLWSVFESIADRVAPERRLSITSNKVEYRVNELLQLSFDVAVDGYLNVLNIGEGEREAVILYPNKFHPDNRVQAGNRVRVPMGTEFRLPARLPGGQAEQRNLVVVVLTQTPLNAFQIGDGTSFLRDLTGETARSFAVEAGNAGDYFAGKIVTVIRK
jgi:uncharacterized caspase-like protein